jgi:hypothetical protein
MGFFGDRDRAMEGFLGLVGCVILSLLGRLLPERVQVKAL